MMARRSRSGQLARNRAGNPGRVLSVVLLAALGACGGGLTTAPHAAPVRRGPPGPIVVAEAWEKNGQRGTHLVFIGEDGRRRGDLTTFANIVTPTGVRWVPHRDLSPAWSPDGKWIVFESTRGRGNDPVRDKHAKRSLWIVEARAGRQPRRLTTAEGSDRDPVWTPDGQHLVFSSNRAGSWDLWRAGVRINRHGRLDLDSPTRITFDAGAEMQPSVAPDGKQVVFRASDAQGRSQLRIVAMSGGESIPLTAGPDDNSPAWSPKGDVIAFAATARAQLRKGAVRNLDLYAIRPDGTGRRLLWGDELFAIEMLPRWSHDGRYVFATSLFRSLGTGAPILSSVVFVDLREQTLNARVLHDVVLVNRLGSALQPKVFDSTALLRNLTYRAGLQRVINRELWREIERYLQRQRKRK